jgi:hypothetical protein
VKQSLIVSLELTFSIFVLLGILFIPFTFLFGEIQVEITQFVFGEFIRFVSAYLGEIVVLQDFSSDSLGLYLLMPILFMVSLLLATSFDLVRISNLNKEKTICFIRSVATYYLAWILLKYGFDKVFKCQFYLPEPNILFTRVGDLDKDILFWSTVGSSRSYSIFMGLLEIIPGILLLFRKTRNLGVLIAIGVFIQVVAINYSFDISVKLFSSFLLLIALFLFAPISFKFWQLLNNPADKINPSVVQNIFFSLPFKFTRIFKLVFIVFIILETLLPYYIAQNFNDDNFKRPILHGAYKMEYSIIGKDLIPESENPIKYIFIHRDGYLIFQNKEQQMQDYKLEVNPKEQTLTIVDYSNKKTFFNYRYSKKSKQLELELLPKSTKSIHYFKAVDWRKMPLLQKQFHWTID